MSPANRKRASAVKKATQDTAAATSFVAGTLRDIRERERSPELVASLILFPMVLGWILFFALDIRNPWFRDAAHELGMNPPLFFYHWFRNGGPIEIVQWITLAASAILYSFIAGRLSSDRRSLAFWGIMSIALAFMVIEDAGDPRHTLRFFVQWMLSERAQGVGGTLVQLAFFGILGAIPLYAFLCFRGAIRPFKKAYRLIIAGFALYAIAVFMSFVGQAFTDQISPNIYYRTGRLAFQLLIPIGDPGLQPAFEANEELYSFELMDCLVEESIELMGAAAFLSAGIARWQTLKS